MKLDTLSTDELISLINDTACKYYSLSQSGADTTNVKQELFFDIYVYLLNRKKFSNSFNVKSDIEILDPNTIVDFLSKKIEKWSPGEADFFRYFIHFFNLRIKSEYKKGNDYEELTDNTVVSKKDAAKDNNPAKDRSHQIQADVLAESKDEVTTLFSVLNEFILTKKKEYENSPKFCYPISFFTELVTRSVSELGIKKAEEDIPEKVLNVIDKDFAVVYLDAEAVGSFADIFRAELRPLSDFTMTEADRNEKCGYALKNVVYRKYVSTVKGKDVSDSAVSQQRKLFEQILGQIRREKLNR